LNEKPVFGRYLAQTGSMLCRAVMCGAEGVVVIRKLMPLTTLPLHQLKDYQTGFTPLILGNSVCFFFFFFLLPSVLPFTFFKSCFVVPCQMFGGLVGGSAEI
jgi:hypothetical protein